MNLAVRRGSPIEVRCRDHHRQTACRDQIAAIVTPNYGISRAAILAAAAFTRIPLMCTRDR
jgi:hypothetical protein